MNPEVHLSLHRHAERLRDRDLARARAHALPPPRRRRERLGHALIRLGDRLLAGEPRGMPAA